MLAVAAGVVLAVLVLLGGRAALRAPVELAAAGREPSSSSANLIALVIVLLGIAGVVAWVVISES